MFKIKVDPDKAAVIAKELERRLEIQTEQESSNMKNDTVEGAKGKIAKVFNNIRLRPTGPEKLDMLIAECEWLFKRIAVELLK